MLVSSHQLITFPFIAPSDVTSGPSSANAPSSRTRNVGPDAMSVLKSSSFDLLINPEDAQPTRQWVLSHLTDPEVVAACIMHSQPSDMVDSDM